MELPSSVTFYDWRGDRLTVSADGPIAVRRNYDTRLHRAFGEPSAREGRVVQALVFCAGTRAHEVLNAEPNCQDCLEPKTDG